MKRFIKISFYLLLTVLLCLSMCSCEFIDALAPDGGSSSGKGNGGSKNNDKDVIVEGDLQIHFLELGNKYTGDCTYIKAGDNDILIDAGSRTNSIPTIDAYLSDYVEDGTLEYVIVTHAHRDHYAGFATNEATQSLFDLYECEVIIDFPLVTATQDTKMYYDYLRERDAEISAGATHYTAAECISDTEINGKFDLGDGITLTILDSYYYYNRSKNENDHSVCTLIDDGKNSYLFTGDLEKAGEEKLVELNDLPQVKLYKAGHHGSKTSSNDVLLSVIKPEIVCVCCCCGSSEFTDNNENQFPTQAFIDRVSVYTDKIYVTTLAVNYDKNEYTSMNGNIVVVSLKGEVTVNCSANNTLLKDTEWFKANRTLPDKWK